MKILIGWFGHETNTFSRRRTDFSLLASQGYWEEEQIITEFRGTPSYLGGMIKRADEDQIELIPTLGVENAGPIISKECLNHIVDKIINYVKEHMGEFKGICLGLHGAGVAEDCDDIETYTLKKIREVVGDNMPITVTLDLHGNITQGMCDYSNGLFGIKENPHTDYAITGYEAMDTLIDIIKNQTKIYTDVVHLPIIMPLISTKEGKYKEITEYIKKYKKENDLLDLCFFPGFPYQDSPRAHSTVFVTARKPSRHHAKFIAEYIWQRKDEFIYLESLNSKQALEEAVKYLNESSNGKCVINEEADNPGCGTPGDGTDLLRELINLNIEDSVFGYIYDPEVVQQAMISGVGSNIDIILGGKLEDTDIHGMPLKLNSVEVCSISNGKFIATTPLMKDIPGSFGNTVRVRYKNVEIIIASVQNQTYDDRAFFVGGVDILQKKLILLKSSQHFKAFYKDIVQKIIAANPIGLSTRNLRLLTYKNLLRPIYPLDKDVVFK